MRRRFVGQPPCCHLGCAAEAPADAFRVGRAYRGGGGVLTKKIAESTQLKTKDVKGVFAALQTIACAEVKKTEKFVIPQLTTLKLKHKPARKAGKKMMFGKEVKVAAKPASKVVKAFPAKALKDSI